MSALGVISLVRTGGCDAHSAVRDVCRVLSIGAMPQPFASCSEHISWQLGGTLLQFVRKQARTSTTYYGTEATLVISRGEAVLYSPYRPPRRHRYFPFT